MRQQCSRCIMDSTASEFVITETGCNFCDQAKKALKEIKQGYTFEILYQLRNNKCLIGLSGGVDSSLALHHAVKSGIKPIAFSLDTGWNDERADENVLKMVEKLKIPFYKETVDLEKFHKLQKAFIRGGIKNVEATTDHILFAKTYEMANRFKIKYVISGGNTATESIMSASWGEDPRDLYWIKSVYKKMTGESLKDLPMLPLWKEQYYRLIKKIKFVRILDYINYNRDKAIELLQKEYDYQPYGEKHCENRFTKWFQNCYLPQKFGIDKRLAHYSSLICSGQMTRERALAEMKKPLEYEEINLVENWREIPIKSYHDYPNSEWVRKIVMRLYKLCKNFTAE